MNDRLTRRDWNRLAGAGLLGVGASGWFDSLAARAAEQGSAGRRKACILLYMNGGPSHVDTFDIKPKVSEFKAIPTAIGGVQFSEHLPKLAKSASDLVVVRGMSTSEGSHARARYYVHTGFREGVGGVVHPTLGSIASAMIGPKKPELPNFVCVAANGLGPGYLGPTHAPLFVTNPDKGVENLKADDGLAAFDRRASLLDEMEKGFLDRKRAPAAEAHRAAYQAAISLMHSEKAKAFDIGAESESTRSQYGSGKFAQGCLLARRLVEFGVPFVEVDMGGWDTHKDNFNRVKRMSLEVDAAMSALVADLKTRGMLDDTLVVWMGDFGRTPDVKGGGRGHYPRAWTSVLAGGGLRPVRPSAKPTRAAPRLKTAK
ncbi:MAG TPA: DUF1501 domain-containing protein [Planctomycetia bacterium]|nr:DUF1501 domain-containing protein [Planctomycetia bacterium]